MKLAERADGISKWHLGGYRKKVSPAVKLYLAVAAAAGRPSESVLLEVMEDDRFIIQAEKSWSTLCSELGYLTDNVSPLLYNTVAGLLDVDVHAYRAHVTGAALTSMGYLYMDLWRPLREEPWKYCVGDIHANVERLKLEPPSADPVASKMQTLALMGFEAEVEAGLKLVREASFSTTLVEQAHGSGASIMRRHPQLGDIVLMDRMTVHNGRALLHPSQHELAHLRLSERIAEVDVGIRNTAYTTERQAYVQMLIDQIKKRRVYGGPSEHAMHGSVFQNHGAHFRALTGEQKAVLHTRASAHRKRRIDDLVEARQHLQGEMDLLRLRHIDSQKDGIVNHLSSVRFQDSEYARFSELWEEGVAANVLNQTMAPPEPVPLAFESLIQEQMRKINTPGAPPPQWLSTLTTHREAFDGCGLFAVNSHDRDMVYKLVLSIAQPYRAIFLECKRCPPQPMARRYDIYSYDSLKFLDQTEVPWQSGDEIMVCPDMSYYGERVHSVGEPEPWSVFTRFLRKRTAEPRSGPSDSRSRTATDPEVLRLLQMEFPWLTLAQLEALLTKKVLTCSGSGGGRGSSSGSRAESPGNLDLAEDIVAAVSQDLMTLREEVGHGAGVDFFTVRVLGGQWSMQRFKQMATDVGCFPKDQSVRVWRSAVGWPPAPGQRNFAVRKFGLAGARMLASEMCRRGNHFMSAWEQSGKPGGFDFLPVAASYRSNDEYDTWFDALPVSGDCFKAAMVIRGLIPRPVPL